MTDLKKIVEDLSKLTILEASELAKLLEKEWGVTAGIPTTNVQLPDGNGSQEDLKIEEKTEFDVFLTEVGPNKINVIKEVRSITGLGLKEAKDLVESAPKNIKNAIKKDEAEKIKVLFEGIGAKIEIR